MARCSYRLEVELTGADREHTHNHRLVVDTEKVHSPFSQRVIQRQTDRALDGKRSVCVCVWRGDSELAPMERHRQTLGGIPGS